MNSKIYLTMILGIAVFLGSAVQSHAACLIDCEEVTLKAEGREGNGRDSRSDEARRNERTQHFGSIRDSVILSGVQLNSNTNVTVGSNSGDINTTSTNIIQGVNKSHNNTNNTTNTSNR